jgi:hypothetical protein
MNGGSGTELERNHSLQTVTVPRGEAIGVGEILDLTRHVHCSASRLVLFLLLLCFIENPLQARVTPEGTDGTGASGFDETPEEHSDDFQFRTVRTDSSRQTLTTFLRLRDDLEETLLAYRDDKTRVLARRMELFLDQIIALLDLSSVPRASQREVGTDTIAYLLDIFGRIELPKLDSVPDEEAFADEAAPAQWRIPRTPIRIVGITEGAREG